MKRYYVVEYDNDGTREIYTNVDHIRINMFKFYTEHIAEWYESFDDDAKNLLARITEDLDNLMRETPYIEDCVYCYEAEMKDEEYF